MPSISDYMGKDDEEKKAKQEVREELVLVESYKIGDIDRFVFWSTTLGVYINVYGKNKEEAQNTAYSIFNRINKINKKEAI